jgi:hypothetical protein
MIANTPDIENLVFHDIKEDFITKQINKINIKLLQIYVDLKHFSSLQLSSKEQFDTHIQNGKQISKEEKFYC